MRVGIFTETFTPDINGVVTSVVALKKALENHGHEVYIVTNHSNVIKTVYEVEDRILRLPGVKLGFLYGYNVSSPIQIQATKLIKSWDLDIIHIQQEFGIGTYGRYLASRWEIPLLNTYHTTYEDYTHYVNPLDVEFISSFSKKVIELYSKSFTKRSNIIITPSQKTKDMLVGYKIDKVINVIPTGLDLESFSRQNMNPEIVNSIREKHGISKDDILFTYVGRIAQEKSIDMIIDAFELLNEEDTKARLLIVGGGPDLEMLRKDVENRNLTHIVQFEGQVSSDQVAHYYHTAQAFISASTSETQGLTYIEALASGIPIFARKDEVLDHIVRDRENGFYFDDSKHLAEVITQYISQPERHAAIGEKALETSQVYSLDNYYDNIIKTYREAIEIEEHENNID